MQTTRIKLERILDRAKKDLQNWLSFAGVCSVEEFFANAESIKQQSYHKYHDTLDHINFIKKLEEKVARQ